MRGQIFDFLFEDMMTEVNQFGGSDKKDNNDALLELLPKPQWSLYADVYDTILCATNTYQTMLAELLERPDGLPALRDGAVVFDLGCGTGNLVREILRVCPNSSLVAVDNNAAMLNCLRKKLTTQLCDVPTPGKTLFMNADICEAMDWLAERGIKADYAFLVNVLFLIRSPETLLRHIAAGLRKGGELRISNPFDKTDLDALFRRLRDDLEACNAYRDLEPAFMRMKIFNEQQLAPMLHRISRDYLLTILDQAGFRKINYVAEDHYGGQSLLISASV